MVRKYGYPKWRKCAQGKLFCPYYTLIHTITHSYTILYITFRHLSSTTFVFQMNIKDVQRCTNHKEKLLRLVRQHMRRQLIERLERSTVCEDGHEVDISTINGEISFSNSACDLGIRYPIFQAAIHGEHLHMHFKVSWFYYKLLHTGTHKIFFSGHGCPRKRILQDKYIPLQAISLCADKCWPSSSLSWFQ